MSKTTIAPIADIPTTEPKELKRGSGRNLAAELKQLKRQAEHNLKSDGQALPSLDRNEGIAPYTPTQASAVNFNAVGDALIVELSIALQRLTPEQIKQVLIKAGDSSVALPSTKMLNSLAMQAIAYRD